MVEAATVVKRALFQVTMLLWASCLALAPATGRAEVLRPHPGWVGLLNEGFEGEQHLHPSWVFRGGWPTFRRCGESTCLVLNRAQAFQGDVGSADWTDHLVTLRFKVTPGAGLAFERAEGDGYMGGHWVVVERISEESLRVTSGSFGDAARGPGVTVPAKKAWQLLEVKRRADRLKVAVNGKPLPRRVGQRPDRGIAFRIRLDGEGEVLLDRLSIKGRRPPAWRVLRRVPNNTIGSTASISVNPARPSDILISSYHSGVLRSEDSGKSWRYSSRGLNMGQVTRLYRSPYKPGLLLAGDQGRGRWVLSLDGGKRWYSAHLLGDEARGRVRKFGPVAFSPVKGERVYLVASSGGAIFRSDDSGRTFRATSGEPCPAQGCEVPLEGLEVTARQGRDQLWVASSPGGLRSSGDSGQTWRSASAVTAPVAAVRSCGDTLWAAGGDGVYAADMAQAAGPTWRKTSLSAGAAKIRCGARGRVYAVGPDGIAWTDDGGKTEQAMDDKDTPGKVADLAPALKPPGDLYVVGAGLHRVSIGSGRPVSLGSRLGGSGIIALTVDPHRAGTVWAGAWFSGEIYRSRDWGSSWEVMFTPDRTSGGPGDEAQGDEGARPREGTTHRIVVDPHRRDTVVALAVEHLIRTVDGGKRWHDMQVSSGLGSRTVTDLKFHPAAPRIAYATTACLARYFLNTNVQCARRSHGLFRSRDGGQTFSRVGAPPGQDHLNVVALDAADPDHLLVGTFNAGLWESRDGGRTFARLGRETLRARHIQDIALKPGAPGVILVAAISEYAEAWARQAGMPRAAEGAPNGIFRSADGGRSWEHLRETRGHMVERVLFAPKQPDTAYYGVHARGVWRSKDSGRSWSSLNEGMLYKDDSRPGFNVAWDIALAAGGKVLYASSGGHGVFRLGKPPGGAPAGAPQAAPPRPDTGRRGLLPYLGCALLLFIAVGAVLLGWRRRRGKHR